MLRLPSRSFLRLTSIVAFGSLGLTSFVTFQQSIAGVLDEIGEEANTVFEKAKPAVVRVRASPAASTSASGFVPSGTGFLIDSEGNLATLSEFVGPDKKSVVTYDGVDVDATAVGTDSHTGMALLHIDEPNTPFLTLGTTNDLKTGYPLIAVGYPLNLPIAPASGFIMGNDIRYLNRLLPTTHIHANIDVSPGQAGGPVLKTNGTVAGIYANTQDEGRTIYVLPSEAMQKLIGDFNKFGKARQGWVGIIVDEVTNDPNARTVHVGQFAQGSPAASSGILPGDTVTRVESNGLSRDVYRPADIMDASFFSHPGDTMTVVVLRDNQPLTYSFILSERPETANVSPDPGAPVVVPQK